MSPTLSAALRLVIDGTVPLAEQYDAIAALDAADQEAIRPLCLALQKRVERERQDASVTARAQAMTEAAYWGAARRGLP